MPSSISDSKRSALAYAKTLAGICGVLVIALEIFSNYLLKHYSATYTRISQQYQQALRIRPAEPAAPTSVLMVGNSLLLHGIEMDRLRDLTSARMRIYPILLEQTGYYDWMYAVRKLFRHGVRPDAVVVGVGVDYFLENSVRQDYVPKLFLDGRDTLAAASDLRLDHTATSNFLLAHSSTFWDTRSVIRMQILNHVVPRLENLFTLINPRVTLPEGPRFEEIALPRLRRFQALCEANGTKLIVLVPPTLSSESAVSQMIAAAHEARVDISVPVDPATLSAKFYRQDGVHLNPEGAVIFTSALAKDLPERVTGHNVLSSQLRHNSNY